MGINIRWIHFVLLLLLVLGGYSGLSGQSSKKLCGPDAKEDCARPEGLPSSIEPASKKKKTTTGIKSAICYTVNPKTGQTERQQGCEVYLYHGAIYPSGGHQDGLDRNGILRKHKEQRTEGQARGNSISALSSTKTLTLVRTPNVSLGGTPLSVAKVGTYQGTGGFPFEIKPSQVGQKEWVIACNGYPNRKTNAGNCKGHNFDVKYSDLKDYRTEIRKNSKTVPIGATGTHPDNHYGTGMLWTAIQEIAKQYHDEFGCYKTAPLKYQPIAINDMALPHGGVFDIGNNWSPPHYSHHRGKAVDIRCKPGLPNSVIPDQQIIDRFLRICEENGLRHARHEDKGKANEHCHCGINEDGE